MNISRFEPWNLINVLHRDFNHLAPRQTGQAHELEADHGVADWVPAVDIVEEKERFVLRADVPGVKPEDIDVSMDKSVLSVSGQRLAESGEEPSGMRRIERTSGKFLRRFKLPETANPGKISANSSNGILEIIIPRQPQPESRRINVKAA